MVPTLFRRLLLVGMFALIVSSASSGVGAQGQTVGLFLNDPASFDGYTLFFPLPSPTTYLIDNDGNLAHSWLTGTGLTAKLEPDGTLWRAVNAGSNPNIPVPGSLGGVKRFDWDGTLLWQYVYASPDHVSHHDIDVLPNGNVLMLAWDYRTSSDAISSGRNPALLAEGVLFPEHIVEVQPTGPTTGNIVWEWHSWDHLVQDFDSQKPNYGVVADHPELIDLNYIGPTRPANGEADWHHANAVDYNPALDQIIISVRHFSEVWVIDHSTTAADAAGHSGGSSGKGGDLLYRWGNAAAYDAGTPSDQKLFMQHDAQWIEPGLPGAGNILVFSNGNGRGYSSVDEIVPPVVGSGNYALTAGQAYGPAAPVWTYSDPPGFYSNFISGAQRLPNGNTLICSGAQGVFFEVTPAGDIVWRYVNPVIAGGPVLQGAPAPSNLVFRAYRYAPDYGGLAGEDLTPGGPIEIQDSDKDGLSDTSETNVYGTDPLAADTDLDGCEDGAEVSANQVTGGLRDPLRFWDFFDAPSGMTSVRDGTVSGLDFFALLQRFGASGDPGIDPLSTPPTPPAYHTAYDRGPSSGPNEWNLTAADGSIAGSDFFAMLAQFGHDCT